MSSQRKVLLSFWIILILFSTLVCFVAICIYNKRIEQFCNLYAPLLDIIGLLIYELCQKERILPKYESRIEEVDGRWHEHCDEVSEEVFTECINEEDIKANQEYNNIVKKIGIYIIFTSFIFWLIAGIINFYV